MITEAMVLMRHIAVRHHKIVFIESLVVSSSDSLGKSKYTLKIIEK